MVSGTGDSCSKENVVNEEAFGAVLFACCSPEIMAELPFTRWTGPRGAEPGHPVIRRTNAPCCHRGAASPCG